MKKKYKIRHDILNQLNAKYQKCNNPNVTFASEIGLDWMQLVAKSKFSESEIGSQIDYLRNSKEINVKQDDVFDEFYVITVSGIASFSDEKYLEEGKKGVSEKFNNRVRNIVMVISLVIAILSFILNFVFNSNNNREIEKLKLEISKMKSAEKAKTR